jgi:hypothetical protein
VVGRERVWMAVSACFRAVLVAVGSSRPPVRRISPSRSDLAAVRGLASRAAATLVLLLVVGVAGGTPVALAEDGPAPFCVPSGVSQTNPVPRIEGQCFDLGATAESEQVAEVAQPASGDPAPAFDSITGVFGGPFNEVRYEFDTDPLRMSPSVTIGGGYVYVATGRYNAPYGMGVYMYSTGEGCPGNPSAAVGALCKVAQRGSSWRPDGIAYYKGSVYVSNTQEEVVRGGPGGRVEIFDAHLDGFRWVRTPALRGIDAAWGELWGRVTDFGSLPSWGVSMDYFAILDPQTGAVRGVVPVGFTPSPRIGDGPMTAPPDCEGGPDEQCFIYWNGPSFAMPKDVAISPELDVISSADFSMHRTSAQALLAGDPGALARFPLPTALENALTGDPGCYGAGPFQAEKDSPVGAYAPWGMRWLIQIDSRCAVASPSNPYRTKVKESSLSFNTDFAGVKAGVHRGAGRTWQPLDQTTEGTRDIAYQTHEPRITWSGRPTESPWQHGNQTLTYFVSDGEFYTVAKDIERWLDPANGFQNVVLKATPTDAQGAPNGSPITLYTSTNWNGTITINEDALASGTYQLTMTATIGAGKTVTKTNPTFRVDHTPPTGTLDALPGATNGTITPTGTLNDAHSGPQSWQVKANGFQVCTRTAPNPDTGKYGCDWNTTIWNEGTYQVQATLSDQVQPAYGGPNTTTVGSATVIVDRTAPSVRDTAPNLYQDAYEGATEQLDLIIWTQSDDRSGISNTTIQLDTSGSSSNGNWTDVGSSPASGDNWIDWHTDSVPNGLYTLRAHTCDRAGNCAHYPWQAEVARVRRANSKCGPNLGYGDYCYVGRASGNDRYYSSYGTRANIYTPAPIKAQAQYIGPHSVAYVGMGRAPGARQWLQTGLSTDCGANQKGGYNYTTDGKDYWGTYVEYTPPRGPRKFQCFSKGATNDPEMPGKGTQPAAGQYQSYAVDVIRDGARARAYIGGSAKVITNTSSTRDEQVWKQSGYLLRKWGQRNSQATGEVLADGRQMSGAFASWEIAYTAAGFSSARPNPQNIIDQGYVLNEASTTRWCVADARRGCTNP